MQLFGKGHFMQLGWEYGALFVSLTLTQVNTRITTLYCRHFYIPTWHGAVQVKQDRLFFLFPF